MRSPRSSSRLVLLLLLPGALARCGGSTAGADARGGGETEVRIDARGSDATLDTALDSGESPPPDTTAFDAAAPADVVADAGAGDILADTAAVDIAFPPAYTLPLLDHVRINSVGEENVRQVDIDFALRDGPFARATLVAELESTCFPFEQWTSNPPPAGHNWPRDCDAFDRNFEFTLDEPAEDGEPPAIELVRAITPFGGPLALSVDITDLANGLAARDEAEGGADARHTLRAHISTWADGSGQVTGAEGGWTLSARIELVPGPAPRDVIAVIPLFNHSIGAGAGLQEVGFLVPEGIASTRLEYRATGHGGGSPTENCIGPADEFCWRTHVLYADGEEAARTTPWRDDCDALCTIAHFDSASGGFDYCAENPCGAIRSVRAPRANWCPGSVTLPFAWEWPELAVRGSHTFAYEILDVGEGGSWRVSATLFAFGE